MMTGANNLDTLFREAVSAIDAGDVPTLERLLTAEPRLVQDRLESPGAWLRDKVGDAVGPGGFFERPYLLWFVAEDPVRNGKLPRNIAEVARAIIRAAKRERVETLQEQLNYALRLVAWSWIARQCNVQLELIDVLIDAGASVGDLITHDALVNGNLEAAGRLVDRGAKRTLATALCLRRWDDVSQLAPTATHHDKQVALVLCALNGQAEALAKLLTLGVDVSAYSTDIYAHATALHHAVCSGSLAAVKVLVEAGAKLDIRDRLWNASPLGWAEHYVEENKGDDPTKSYPAIAAYLREKGGQP
jgi:peptide-methionine (S)-S-oxide reductase